MKRKEIVDHLNSFLEIEKFSDYCPHGLQVEGAEEVKNVAVAVSANLLTIEAAVAANVDTLIVHHGLFWVSDPYPVVGPKKRKLELLLKHNINLLGYHLPLDAHRVVGNNWKAAQEMGWQSLEEAAEIGVRGQFDPLSVEDFVAKLESYYGHKAHTALFGSKKISSATLISGGAWRRMLDDESDCFITGSFDEPVWGWAQERGKHFIAMGHSATEEVGPKALGAYIQETFGLKTAFLEIKNPF